MSDGEDDEWRGPSGSLLGSDVLARRYHSSGFASAPQESQQELEIGPGNGPTEIQPHCHPSQGSRQELENESAGSSDFAPTAQESPQEQDIVPADTSMRTKPKTHGSLWALARVHKYGRRKTTAKKLKGPMYTRQGLDSRTRDFVSQHSTDHLTKFDPKRPYHVQAVAAERPYPHSSFYHFKGYHLCMDPSITSALEVPQLPVRLDDRLVALVYEGFLSLERGRLWPCEFDCNGTIRSGRIPLGFAAKHEYKVGDVDFDGNVLQPGEEGWYYLWLGGVHCLMGKEGMDAGRFQMRDLECRTIVGFAFRKSHRAEIQAPPGAESES